MKKLIPRRIRQVVRGTRWWQRRYNTKRAFELASQSKRLDLCAAQMAHLLHLAGTQRLEGKVCMELGCGWVLTHALVCHLLGAKRVVAVDIDRIARPRFVSLAVRGAEHYIVRDVLSPFAPHPEIRARLERLAAVSEWDLSTLEQFGIDYLSPVDLTRVRLGQTVDFIYSLSVLEHVPVEDIDGLLSNLLADLSAGGAMIHAIHLEDHRDLQGSPFRFLAMSAASYGRSQQSEYGNRVRRSGWRNHFDQLRGFDWRFIYEFSRVDKPLPEEIDPAVAHEGEDDLRVSHIGVHGVKRV